MKKSLFIIISLLLSFHLFSQTPESFKYQAVIRSNDGTVIADQTIGIQIEILQGSETGTPVYTETHSPTTNQFGLITLNIGEGIIISGVFADIDWGSDSFWVKISVDVTGGTSYTETGTSQLLSVPYALHSKTAGNTPSDIWSVNGNDIFYNSGRVGIGIDLPESDLHIYSNNHPWFTIETYSTDKWAISELIVPGSMLQFSVLGNDATGGGVILKNTVNIDAIAPAGLNIINEENSHIAFFTEGYHPPNEKMRILSDGKIGIGTSNPNAKLEVHSNGFTGDTLFCVKNNNGTPLFFVLNDIVKSSDNVSKDESDSKEKIKELLKMIEEKDKKIKELENRLIKIEKYIEKQQSIN
jgi:hypothetical protein